ncbi:hypothetical protein D3C87_110330 [compost metagenome]
MNQHDRIPSETKKVLQNFAVAYFFVLRIKLENAELIERSLQNQVPKNLLLSELAHGYINGAITEFVLLLYDSAALLKRHTGNYEYKVGGSIDKIFKFRRHILAHRGCNWGSEESMATIEGLSQERIFQTSYKAANEFVLDLRRYMSFEPIEKNPAIQKIRKPDFDNLLKNSPELGFHTPVFEISDVINFFGSSLLPEKGR